MSSVPSDDSPPEPRPAQGDAPPPAPPAAPGTVDTTPFLLELAQCPELVSWLEFFGNDHPVELEVGSGKGLFLANAARANPGHNYVGIELARKYAGRAADRVAKLGLRNVRVVRGDARMFLSRSVPSESLAMVHVYFPDPWWKKRHKKRRVFAEPLVADIERTLVPGGELRVVTDVEEYFGVITELMASRPRFDEIPLPEPKAPEHDLDYLTNFERKYRIEGRPIYRRYYRLAR
jgi:tRNA (guanine-N7-)-methyltransferase